MNKAFIGYGYESKTNLLKRGFSSKEAAAYIGMSEAYLRLDRSQGATGNRTPGPPYIKRGRRIIYLREDLDAWLEKVA